jgi:hypothetical protein
MVCAEATPQLLSHLFLWHYSPDFSDIQRLAAVVGGMCRGQLSASCAGMVEVLREEHIPLAVWEEVL